MDPITLALAKRHADSRAAEIANMLTITNMVSNGDFSSGINSWQLSHATSSITDHVLSIVGDGTSSVPKLTQNTLHAAVPGHKIYVSAKVTAKTSDVSYFFLTAYNTDLAGSFIRVLIRSSPIIDTPYTLSGVITVPENWTGNLRVTIETVYASPAEASGKESTIESVIAIDITDTFGEGQEPDISIVESLLASFPNSWFDGTKTVVYNFKGFFNTEELRPILESIVNKAWAGWLNTFYSYGLNRNTVKTPIVLDGITEVKGTIISNAPAAQRRWGLHVFEGWSTNGTDRLTMLVDKHADYAEIYYYYQPPDGVPAGEGYKWVKIGSDVANTGVDFTKDEARSHVPFTFKDDVILVSPNGSKYAVRVDNSGALSTTLIE